MCKCSQPFVSSYPEVPTVAHMAAPWHIQPIAGAAVPSVPPGRWKRWDLVHLKDLHLHHLTSLPMVVDLQALLALNKHLQPIGAWLIWWTFRQQALHKVHVAHVVQKEDLQPLLLTQPMEWRTLGISGGRQRQDLQHLKKKPLKMPTFLQKTRSRPLDG